LQRHENWVPIDDRHWLGENKSMAATALDPFVNVDILVIHENVGPVLKEC
jgi:hypothetical protein